MRKGIVGTLMLLLGLLPIVATAQAQGDETGQVYVVQNGDGLYKLSRKFFGNLSGVAKIVKAHNAKAESDERFAEININNQLEIGQLLWIPVPLEQLDEAARTAGDSETLTPTSPPEPEKKPIQSQVVQSAVPAVQTDTPPPVSSTKPAEPATVPTVKAKVSSEIARAREKELAGVEPSGDRAIIVDVPRSNCEIRVWYNYQVVAIGRLNERWKANGMPLLERAKRAYTIRHNARVNGRYMMQDRFEVATLRDRDNKKYGNPDGPTFDYLVNYHRESGFEGDDIYRRIIESSARTSPVFNSECQK